MGKSKSILFLNEGRYVWVAFALLAIHYNIYYEILDKRYPKVFKIEPRIYRGYIQDIQSPVFLQKYRNQDTFLYFLFNPLFSFLKKVIPGSPSAH